MKKQSLMLVLLIMSATFNCFGGILDGFTKENFAIIGGFTGVAACLAVAEIMAVNTFENRNKSEKSKETLLFNITAPLFFNCTTGLLLSLLAIRYIKKSPEQVL